MSQTTFIDADTHITEPADVWTSRVPARWKDDVPQVRWDDEKQEEVWTVAGNDLMPVGFTALAGFDGKFPDHPARYQDSHPGSYDASARLRYMDEIGCAAQVLYPNVGGFGSGGFLKLGEGRLAALVENQREASRRVERVWVPRPEHLAEALDSRRMKTTDKAAQASVCDGELLANGICSPPRWPPATNFSARLPLPPYLRRPPNVINVSCGRQLWVRFSPPPAGCVC